MFTILDSKKDKDKWLQEIETKNYDLFLDPDFVNASLLNSHSFGKLIVYKNMNKYFLHCFQLNKIMIKDLKIKKKDYFDISHQPDGSQMDKYELNKFRVLQNS